MYNIRLKKNKNIIWLFLKLKKKMLNVIVSTLSGSKHTISIVTANFHIFQYYIWCGFRTIPLAKSVTWYTEYLMYFFHCEETRRLVSIFKKYWRYFSIFKYIDVMLLNLDPDIVRSGPRLHSICSKQHLHQYSKIS